MCVYIYDISRLRVKSDKCKVHGYNTHVRVNLSSKRTSTAAKTRKISGCDPCVVGGLRSSWLLRFVGW